VLKAIQQVCNLQHIPAGETAMIISRAIFTIALLVAATPAVVAQPQRPSQAFEALGDVLGLAPQIVRGHVVQHREATLMLRGDDGRMYMINTAGLDAAAMARLKEGRPVTVTVKSGTPGAMPIAAVVEPIDIQPSAAVAGSAHQRVHGVVEALGLGSLTLKTSRGDMLIVDTTQVTEPVRARPGDLVTILGKISEEHSERFVAEAIESDAARAPAATPSTGR
jgi:hypothetical protein